MCKELDVGVLRNLQNGSLSRIIWCLCVFFNPSLSVLHRITSELATWLPGWWSRWTSYKTEGFICAAFQSSMTAKLLPDRWIKLMAKVLTWTTNRKRIGQMRAFHSFSFRVVGRDLSMVKIVYVSGKNNCHYLQVWIQFFCAEKFEGRMLPRNY